MLQKGHNPHELERITQYSKEKKAFIHYTCNAPSQEVLDFYDIQSIGKQYGCANSREVLMIPLEVYLEAGLPFTNNQGTLIINLENLMVKLEREAKRNAA